MEDRRASDREKDRLWRAKNPEKVREYNQRQYYKDIELTRKRRREYAKNNPARVSAAVRKWVVNNPEKKRAVNRRARVRRLSAEGNHTIADVRRLFALQGEKCAACRCRIYHSGSLKYEVDHVLPLSKGGSDYPNNLQLLCLSCNRRKTNKTPAEWAALHGRLFV